MSSPLQKPPDFIVLGGEFDGKVYLVASKSLREATLREESEYPENFYGLPRRFRDEIIRIFIEAEMRDYVIVSANTYPEAWDTLFKCWQPSPAERKEIENGRNNARRALHDGEPDRLGSNELRAIEGSL